MKNSRIILSILALAALAITGYSLSSAPVSKATDCCEAGAACCSSGASCCAK